MDLKMSKCTAMEGKCVKPTHAFGRSYKQMSIIHFFVMLILLRSYPLRSF